MRTPDTRPSKLPAPRLSLESRTALHREFAERGLLLKQDARLPDVVGFLAGGPIRGSWWTHPGAHALFDALQEFTAGPDCLEVKLVAGKDTFVHRRLWPAVLGAALENAAWQTDGLSAEAVRLLETLEKGEGAKASGPPAREILTRLLAHGKQVHTAAGKHVLELETWEAWQRRKKAKPLPADEARARLEEVLLALGGRAELLPWKARKRLVRKKG
jgi:hypothetical protein